MTEGFNNFAFPEFSIGFHSGWTDGNETPTNKLSLHKRRKVYLREERFTPIWSTKEYCPKYLLKVPKPDKIIGLSSGVGSTIINKNGRFFKIKRNGYKNREFIEGKIPDRGFSLKNEGLYEQTDFEAGGIMSLEDAENEVRFEKIIAQLGIEVPQKTIALYKLYPSFLKNDAVALIQEINSDFRADELVSIFLINRFYGIFGSNFKIFLNKEECFYPSYSINEGLKILKEGREEIKKLSKIIGGLYKKLHSGGIIRGIGNSWYGNEIICAEGSIGMCDFESCFTLKDICEKETFGELAKTDLNLARTAFYDSMNYFDNSLASILANWLIDGFNEGYSEGYMGKISPEWIQGEIKKFIKHEKEIIVW